MSAQAFEPAPDAIDRAIAALTAWQEPSGSLPGDYSGPLFLPALYLLALRATGTPMPDADRVGMIDYLRAVQNADGGFGLGEQNPSCVFSTSLCYVSYRLLGLPPEDPDAARARAFLHAQGGALHAASWGRFILCILNVHDWEGIHPVPPETWLLPYAAPIHPGRFWCHARQVYLPMAWLYGARYSLPLDELALALREELYGQPYATIRWRATRDLLSPLDAYAPRTPASRAVNAALAGWERAVPSALRRRALDHVLDHIRYEDDTSDSICIGPVNKVYDLLVWQAVEPGGPRVAKHLERLADYVSRDARGVRMNGYNSSRFWDTVFMAQALDLADRPGAREALAGALRYVDDHQVRTELPERDRYHRDRRLGGWPFSDAPHGWPITDCTAEGITVSLALRGRYGRHIDDERLQAAVDRLIERQNPDGGWASYEKARGGAWLEALNPSDIFSDIMIDYSYVECTAAVVHALDAWRRRQGARPDRTVDDAIDRARTFLLSRQQPDGAFFGSWAVCYTYGTWFGVRGLRAAGLEASHPAIRRAVAWLVAAQLPDGSWSEHVDSCRAKRSLSTGEGMAVMTSWALLALADAGEAGSEAARRGAAWLEAHQRPDGTWDQAMITGIFNKTCSINYDNYRRYFPLWALAAVRAGRGHA